MSIGVRRLRSQTEKCAVSLMRQGSLVAQKTRAQPDRNMTVASPHSDCVERSGPDRKRSQRPIPMRVVIAHNFYQQAGGEDQCVAAEIAMLRAHGHEVVEYSISNDLINGMNPEWRDLYPDL